MNVAVDDLNADQREQFERFKKALNPFIPLWYLIVLKVLLEHFLILALLICTYHYHRLF